MLSAFSCREIDEGEYWLIENLDIRCWADEHAFYTMFVALPGLLAWGIITPGIILTFIIRNRNNHDNDVIDPRFVFLIQGYKKSTYYWEFIILYRKVLIVFVSVFMSSVSVMIQGQLACLILFIAFFI